MTKSDDLFEAIRRNDAKRVAELLDEDRTLLRAKSGNTSGLLFVVYHGHPEMVQLFTSRGAQLSFHEACALGDRARVHELLKEEPSLLASYSEDGYPACGLSIFFKHPELARELIEWGADVNAAARNPQRVAPVHAAAAVCDHDTMRLLLERGADPNTRQQGGFTAFHSAASRGDIEMARLLLAHGADPHARTDDGKTAAEIAEQYKQPAFAEWFRANV
ncbi:MAG TPA: ankyrin repeat domain-containing protein [Nitrospirales bacterium]|nr:ankyrin repeat domain-containing protein [Nitrospirales bacterium]